MEYIEGEPLRCPMNLRNALLYAGQILEALEAAHRHGIVHRDLKPSNVMLTSSGVKLLDFGLAKRPETANEDVTATMGTAEHTVVGTPRYMAPEQIEGPVDYRTDIFAFGCVLYEMIAGKPAFEGRSAQTVMAAILECDNRNFDELQAPAAMKEIVANCLRHDPKHAGRRRTISGWRSHWRPAQSYLTRDGPGSGRFRGSPPVWQRVR